MKKIFLAFFFVTCFFVPFKNANALLGVVGVEAEVRYFYSNLSSEFLYTDNSVAGTEFSFEDEFDVDQNKGFAEIRLGVSLLNQNLRYSYLPMSWTGTETLTTTIEFGGTSFAASTLVDTELTLDYHRLSYIFDFIDMAGYRLGVIVEAKYIKAFGEVKNAVTGIGEDESVSLPIPALGVIARAGIPFLLNVSAEVTGMTLGSDFTIIDAEAALNFEPVPFFTFSLGYRHLDIHFEYEDKSGGTVEEAILLDALISGPFAALRFNF